MTPEEIGLTIALTLAGIAATAFFAVLYYRKGMRETNRRFDSVESLGLVNAKINRDKYPHEGKPVKQPDGTYAAQFARQINEKVNFTEKVTVIKNPGTDREEVV